jgi:hypothetical protein
MARPVRKWILVPALAGVLGGCLPGSEGPSIPSTPATPRPAALVSEKSPAPAQLKKRLFRQKNAKVQAVPRTRTLFPSEEAQ